MRFLYLKQPPPLGLLFMPQTTIPIIAYEGGQKQELTSDAWLFDVVRRYVFMRHVGRCANVHLHRHITAAYFLENISICYYFYS